MLFFPLLASHTMIRRATDATCIHEGEIDAFLIWWCYINYGSAIYIIPYMVVLYNVDWENFTVEVILR